MLVFSKAYFVALANIEKNSNASSVLARDLAMHSLFSTMHRVALSRGMCSIEEMAKASPMHRCFQPCIHQFQWGIEFFSTSLSRGMGTVEKMVMASPMHRCITNASRHHQCIEVFQPCIHQFQWCIEFFSTALSRGMAAIDRMVVASLMHRAF